MGETPCMTIAIICLAAVAVFALALSAFLAWQLVLAHRNQDNNLQEFMKESRQERSELVTRIQRPELVPATPADRARLQEAREREQRTRTALAQVGTVAHTDGPSEE